MILTHFEKLQNFIVKKIKTFSNLIKKNKINNQKF